MRPFDFTYSEKAFQEKRREGRANKVRAPGARACSRRQISGVGRACITTVESDPGLMVLENTIGTPKAGTASTVPSAERSVGAYDGNGLRESAADAS